MSSADKASLSALGNKEFALERLEGRLVLRDLQDPQILPLSVDFLAPALIHRLRNGMSKSQPLARALGLRGAGEVRVLDATAGLGIDAFIMAAYGCRVRALERSPIVFSLLEDGYVRLCETKEKLLAEIAARIQFECADATEILRQLSENKDKSTHPEVVYLDPMYPEEGRSKSALPKKSMQMFRRLIGADENIEELFNLARDVALKRVVVKRPLHAPQLAQPTHSFSGKTARFDMYARKLGS